MLWFFIAILGYLLLAVVFVLDKFILTKSVPSPVVYTFYSTIFMLVLLPVYLFGIEPLTERDWVIALVSGISFGFALWTMYLALRYGEASHITPFIGGVIAITTFVGGFLFLHEQLSHQQMIGIAVLVVASLLFSFEKSKTYHGIHLGFVWAACSGGLYAISHVSAKYIYESYPFLTGLVTTKATIGVVGILTLCFPVVWQSFKRSPQKKAVKKEKKHIFALVFSNKLLGIIAVVLIQYAISLGSVTIVNAMNGIQYVVMFLFIYLMSKRFPKVFQEYFTKKEIIIEVVALALVLTGSVLLVV